MAAVRRLNKRLVTTLTIGLMLVLAFATFLILSQTVKKDPELYGTRGDDLMAADEPDYKKAAQAYERAYHVSDKDPKWLVSASEAYYMNGEVGRAMSALERAIIADSNLVVAQKRIVEIMYEIYGRMSSLRAMGQMQKKAELLLEMLATADAKDPEVAKILALAHHCRGLALYAQRSPKQPELAREATKEIEEAIALDLKADYITSLSIIPRQEAVNLARLAAVREIDLETYGEYVRQMREKVTEAAQIYVDALERSAGDSELLLGLGLLYKTGQAGLEIGLADFCDAQAQLQFVKARMRQQELTELRKNQNISEEEKPQWRSIIRKAIQRHKFARPRWARLAEEHKNKGKKIRQEGLDTIIRAVEQANDDDQKIQALLVLGTYQIEEQQFDKVEQIVQQLLAIDPARYESYQLGYKLYWRQAAAFEGEERAAKMKQAEDLLVRRLEMKHNLTGPEGRKNMLQQTDLKISLIRLYLYRRTEEDLNRADEYLDELERVMTNLGFAGSLPAIHQFKGDLALARGQVNKAIKNYEEASSRARGDIGLKLTLANLYVQQGEMGAAKGILDEALAAAPGHKRALAMAGAVALQQDQPKRALEYAERILMVPDEENNIAALNMKLRAFVILDRIDDAREVKKALEKNDVQVNLSLLIAMKYKADRNYEEAEKLLKEALAAEPGEKYASMLLAEVYAAQEQKPEALKIIDQAMEKNPDDESLQAFKERLGAENATQVREQAISQTIKNIEEIEDPFVKAVRFFSLYMNLGDLEQARKYLDEIRKLDPKRSIIPSFQFGLAAKDWAMAEDATARARAEDLDGINGLLYEARLISAMAWEQANQGNAEQATKLFEEALRPLGEAVKELPRKSLLRALLAEAYLWLGRVDEADTQLEAATELSAQNPYVLRALALRQWHTITGEGLGVDPDLVTGFIKNVGTAIRKMAGDEWLKKRAEWINEQVALQKELLKDKEDDPEAVVSRREKIRKENPQDIRNLLRLASVYENREKVRDMAKAEQCYQQAIEQAPAATLLRAYFSFAARNKRVEGLETFLKAHAVKLAQTGSGNGYTLLGVFFNTTRQNDLAEQAFKDAVKVEDSASKRLGLAVLYGRLGKFDKTVTWATRVLDAKPDQQQDRSARILLIKSLLRMDRWDEASSQIDKFQQEYPGPGSKMFAVRLALARENTFEAGRLLSEILEENPFHVEALLASVDVHVYTWQLESAKNDLERLAEVSPKTFGNRGRIQLAKLYCELGRPDDAAKEARKLLSAATSRPRWMEALRIDVVLALSSSLPESDYEKLLVWAGNKHKKYWGWPFEQGRLFLRQEKFRDAQKVLGKAWKLVKQSPFTLRVMVLDKYLEALFRAKQYRQVITVAGQKSTGLDKPIARMLAWQAAALYMQGKEAQAAKKYLEALKLAKDQPLSIWQITRKCLLEAISPKELIAMLEDTSGKEKDVEGAVKMAAACAYFAAGQSAKGYQLYKELIERQADPKARIAIWYMASQQFSDKWEYEQAVQALVEANKLEPENAAVLNNLAYLYAEYLDQPQKGLKLIEQVYKAMPDNADLLDTYGRILHQVGQKDRAMVYLAKSVWRKDVASNRYHLGMLLLDDQARESEARLQLERALALVEDDEHLERRIQEVLKQIRGD